MTGKRFVVVFMPGGLARRYLGRLRRRLCRRTNSTQALQAPVHISFMRTSPVAHEAVWLQCLQRLCATQRPFTLRPCSRTVVRPERFWAGVAFRWSAAARRLLHRVENCAREHVRPPRFFRPVAAPLHLTLCFPAKVEHIKRAPLALHALRVEGLTVLEQLDRNGAYRVRRHLPFGVR